MICLQILGKSILFGAVASEGGNTGERCGGTEQINPIGRTRNILNCIRGERIAVAAAGQEVQRHHPERARRITYQGPTANQHIKVIALAVLDGEVEDATAGGLGEIEAERYAAHLGETPLVWIDGNAVL